jgi:hypothetical protein
MAQAIDLPDLLPRTVVDVDVELLDVDPEVPASPVTRDIPLGCEAHPPPLPRERLGDEWEVVRSAVADAVVQLPAGTPDLEAWGAGVHHLNEHGDLGRGVLGNAAVGIDQRVSTGVSEHEAHQDRDGKDLLVHGNLHRVNWHADTSATIITHQCT